MLPCGCWIAPYRRTEARASRRILFLRQHGRMCARCDLPTGRMKCIWNRLRSGSWPKARNRQKRRLLTDRKSSHVHRNVTRLGECMPTPVVRNPQSLKQLVGREFEATEWFPVTQDRIALFAEATEDRQWIHLDRARA